MGCVLLRRTKDGVAYIFGAGRLWGGPTSLSLPAPDCPKATPWKTVSGIHQTAEPKFNAD
jgi:hypothetical protein